MGDLKRPSNLFFNNCPTFSLNLNELQLNPFNVIEKIIIFQIYLKKVKIFKNDSGLRTL
jgi:hypothetical protein